MTLTVNGINLVPYLVDSGYKLTRADGDSSDAGRTMDYLMHRGRIATKYRIDATLKTLTKEQAYQIMPALMPEYVAVTYTNCFTGQDETTTMYSNNNVATITDSYDGADRWEIDPIALIER